jgi:hypothetical protein
MGMVITAKNLYSSKTTRFIKSIRKKSGGKGGHGEEV